MTAGTINKVAFIGLGVMGYPMAGHLSGKGLAVTVYNRTASRAAAWLQQFAGTQASTPAGAATGADVVLVCVGNDADVRSVVFGDDGALAGMRPGALLIDHTTASAELARELQTAAAALQIEVLDAPVSGGQAGAENGKLTIMVGGSESAFLRAQPVFEAYGKFAKRMGDVGAGQLTKMVNQICIAGVLQGLAEGLAFAERAGLDGNAVVEVISKGAAQSWQMENRYQTMLKRQFEFGFAVDWMRKDLGLALNESRRNGALLPMAALVDQFYAEVQALGGARWDTSSLIKRLDRSTPAS